MEESINNFTDPLTAFAQLSLEPGDPGDLEVNVKVTVNESNLLLDPHLTPYITSYEAVRTMQTILVPAIFAAGLIGNGLAIGCFLSHSLRSVSCCVYMAAKCTSDSLFLLTLFIMWLNRLDVGFFNFQGKLR